MLRIVELDPLRTNLNNLSTSFNDFWQMPFNFAFRELLFSKVSGTTAVGLFPIEYAFTYAPFCL